MLHVRDVRARSHAPLAHAVRVLLGVVLDGERCAAIRVAFAQDRVHGRAKTLRVALLNCLLFVGLRVFRIVRNLVALRLEFLDGALELEHRSADVRQLDDVRVRVLSQAAELGEVIRHALFFGQEFGEFAEDTARDRDVARLDSNARRCGERADDREEGAGGQKRSFVGQGVDDAGLLRTHRWSRIQESGKGGGTPPTGVTVR